MAASFVPTAAFSSMLLDKGPALQYEGGWRVWWWGLGWYAFGDMIGGGLGRRTKLSANEESGDKFRGDMWTPAYKGAVRNDLIREGVLQNHCLTM